MHCTASAHNVHGITCTAQLQVIKCTVLRALRILQRHAFICANFFVGNAPEIEAKNF